MIYVSFWCILNHFAYFFVHFTKVGEGRLLDYECNNKRSRYVLQLLYQYIYWSYIYVNKYKMYSIMLKYYVCLKSKVNKYIS